MSTPKTTLIDLLHFASQTIEILFHKHLPKDLNATARQITVLRAIEDDISQTGIVDRTGIDRSTLAEIIRRLERRGLLVRKRSKADARAYEVRLSAQGKKLIEKTNNAIEMAEKNFLGEKDRAALTAILGRVSRA